MRDYSNCAHKFVIDDYDVRKSLEEQGRFLYFQPKGQRVVVQGIISIETSMFKVSDYYGPAVQLIKISIKLCTLVMVHDVCAGRLYVKSPTVVTIVNVLLPFFPVLKGNLAVYDATTTMTVSRNEFTRMNYYWKCDNGWRQLSQQQQNRRSELGKWRLLGWALLLLLSFPILRE